jgi:hypothetical protein
MWLPRRVKNTGQRCAHCDPVPIRRPATGLNLDATSAQMVERCLVLIVRNREGVMDTAMVVADGIDRRVSLHQDEAGASRIEEGHVPTWHCR